MGGGNTIFWDILLPSILGGAAHTATGRSFQLLMEPLAIFDLSICTPKQNGTSQHVGFLFIHPSIFTDAA